MDLYFMVPKFCDVGRMTLNKRKYKSTKCNEVRQVTSLQLLSLSTRKDREPRKRRMEQLQLTSSENSHEDLDIFQELHLHYFLEGSWFARKLLCTQETKHLSLHPSKKFQNGYKYPQSRSACSASTDSCTVNNSSTTTSFIRLKFSLLTYNEQ